MKPYLITNSDRPGWVGKPPPVNVLCIPFDDVPQLAKDLIAQSQANESEVRWPDQRNPA